MSDPRFTALSKDPRYRLPSRKEARTVVDPRFSRLFQDQDFRKKASVDRYGRKFKADAGQKELERIYRLENDEKEPKRKKFGLVNEESEDEDEDEDESGNEEDLVGEKKDRARQGGFSESESSEEETSDEEESDEEIGLAEETAGQEQTEEVEMGEVTYRMAAVNLDWDHIRAEDLLAVASSLAPAGGKVRKVTVYPSEFGRERLEREEVEGPPREIFASSKKKKKAEESDSDEDEDEKIRKKLISEQADEGDEFDTAKLRQYQLERLRYYYAVIVCDSKTTAKALYDQMDGREYLTTANFFDLRFIPDGTSFEEDTPREECSKLPESYKPNDFKTEALTHSKVRLTWDDDDTTRKEVQKRAFSRAEMDENDLKAYIGSDSSDAESTTSRKSTAEDRKAQKIAAQKAKMRAALGLGDETAKKSAKDTPVGDMEITFTSFTGGKDRQGIFENEPQDEESTRARYIRKEKERKQKRKEKMKAGRSGEVDEDETKDEDGKEGAHEEDDPFDDPFFNDPAAAAAQEKKARKAEKEKKRAARDAAAAEAEARRAELELLMAEDGDEKGLRHFDMREIEKAEKEAKRKGKKGKGKKGKREGDAVAVEDDFKVETEDPRFKALFESHEYAIDPTNPRFKGTSGMKSLLEEGRKKRKREDVAEDGAEVARRKKGAVQKGEDELQGLVARLKKKGGKR